MRISAPFQEFLLERMQIASIRKNDYLVQEGTLASRLYFISTGLLRLYSIDNGEEVIFALVKEREVIVSPSSFFHRIPSKESLQAVEDSEVVSISQSDLEFCYNKFPESNIIAREILTKTLAESEKRMALLKIKDATTRYRTMIQLFPELVQRVPVMYLASYLGIRMETLSRIRGRIH